MVAEVLDPLISPLFTATEDLLLLGLFGLRLQMIADVGSVDVPLKGLLMVFALTDLRAYRASKLLNQSPRIFRRQVILSRVDVLSLDNLPWLLLNPNLLVRLLALDALGSLQLLLLLLLQVKLPTSVNWRSYHESNHRSKWESSSTAW